MFCPIFTSPNWVILNPVFSRVCRVCSFEIKADGRKLHSIFFLILQKRKDNFFIECTQIKADLLQFRLSSWPRGVASTVGRGINPVIASARMRSFKHSTFTMQPVHYHYKTTGQTYGKNTLLCLNMLWNLCCLALSPYRREVMQNILFYVDIVRVNK